MKVKNINGSSDNTTCKCGSWLKHWVNFGGITIPSYCPVIDCLKKPTVGAHVQKDESSDKSWYIIPLCSEHNNMMGETIEVSDSVTLVSANVSETCGKSD